MINYSKYAAIGTHHLEYGFPSTHSANTVSIALFFFTRLHLFYADSGSGIGWGRMEGDKAYGMLAGALIWYTFSIVFGRLYTAMHSFTDCVVGVVMGAGIWCVHDGHWGLGAGAWVEGIVEGYGVGGVFSPEVS
jgi:dihydrosphingosine 1-phosphate phosphatase